MKQHIEWFARVLGTSIALYFKEECDYNSLAEVGLPDSNWLETTADIEAITFEERVVIMLALIPQLSPQLLDILFIHNKDIGRPYTEFGGWKGTSHNGFLPTGETAAFILAGKDVEKRKSIIKLFGKDHWFYRKNILSLEGAGEKEPFLSGQLCPSDELLSKVLYDKDYEPDFNSKFPAKHITSQLSWKDLVLDYQTLKALEEIDLWHSGFEEIMKDQKLSRYLKPGYRALFYGPSGTGKTLAATLIGQNIGMKVYRIDLSQIVSKYIGETEKNLARVFDMAENQKWLLFFDEADALFGKRTSANTSNDRYANQEVAYLLQRIEDFPGTVILATNLRSNIDDAFSRRFQSIVYFPMPNQDLRAELWQRMLPDKWLHDDSGELIRLASETELSGGSITNVIRSCAIRILGTGERVLIASVLKEAIQREKMKL